MPAHPAKVSKPAPQKVAPKLPEEKSPPWKYMCIRTDIHSRLDEQRMKRAEAMGFRKLSWTQFFALLADDLEKRSREAVI